MNLIKRASLLISIYFFVWITLYETRVFNQTDSLWSVYTSVSLVEEGSLDLTRFETLFSKAFHSNLIEMKGHVYNYYPYGISVLALPYVWTAGKWYSVRGKNLTVKIISSSTISLEKNISSSLLSISACIFFLLSFYLTDSLPRSIFIVFIFSFCTLIFSTLSRGLWQHVGSIFLLSLVIYSFTIKKQYILILSALPLFFSYVVRPTNILPIFFLSLAAIYKLRTKSIFFLGLGLLTFSGFFYINQNVFGSPIHPYYDFRKVGSSDRFYEALLGNLFSPGRGLFMYSPVFIFSFYGIYLKKKIESINILDYAFFSIVIIHWILVSRNLNWWGGHSYGYRLLSDIIPFFVYYLIYYIKYIQFKSVIFGFFLFSVIVSSFINFRGAQFMETYLWNLTPTNIDNTPARIWDWKDLPYLR